MIKDFFILIALFILMTGCKLTGPSSDKEGIVTYSIEYPGDNSEKSLAAFLPNKMVTYYKNDHFKLKFKGEFNLYNLEFISRSQGDTCYTLFRIFDKKLFYPMDNQEKLFLFNDLGQSNLMIFPDSIKKIAGIECTKAILTFDDTATPDIEVYFSNQIHIANPNRHSPFAEVPGLMLEFSMMYQGMLLKFQAQDISLRNIDDQEFCLPATYAKTDRDEIKDLVLTLLQ